MPPIEKPVSSSASRAVARRTSRSPVTAASRARSTRFGPGDEAEDRLEAAVLAGRDEDEGLDDLAELRADGAAASSAVWVDSSKTVTSSVTPFRAAASRTRWIPAWSMGSGTGRV